MNTAATIDYFIGVDGGGTGSRLRLVDSDGIVLASATGGPANVYLDFDRAIRTLRDTIAAGLASAALRDEVLSTTALGLGLAGVSASSVAEQVRAAFPEFARVTVSNDGLTACLGAHGGRDGGLAIVGTGSAAVLRLHGTAVNFGGRGFHLGDDGSGACMGRDLVRKALRAHDDLEPWTPLLRAVMAEFDDDPVRVIQWGREAASRDFAAYAPLVFEAAKQGDAAAQDLANRSAEAIGELILALRHRGAPRIALVGGLAAALSPFLDPSVRALLQMPKADALAGALLLAGGRMPGSSDER